MACFEIKNLSFSYPGAPGEAPEGGREHSGAPGYFDTPKALQDIDLTVEDGEYVLLCGKSGCGKTTLLRMIAGLEEITEGEIRMGDINITNLEPGRENTVSWQTP